MRGTITVDFDIEAPENGGGLTIYCPPLNERRYSPMSDITHKVAEEIDVPVIDLSIRPLEMDDWRGMPFSKEDGQVEWRNIS